MTKGYTFFEVLIVLAIFGVLLSLSFAAIQSTRGGDDLDAEARSFSRVLEFARNRTVASEGDAQYGVYVDTTTTPHQYVLFQGTDYASRQMSEDRVYVLRSTIEFDTVSFSGGDEIVFNRIQGTTEQAGNAVLQRIAQPAQERTVYVESGGVVGIDAGFAPDDLDRVTDTRHVHIDYSGRVIDTLTEDITLDFGTVTETIVIADNLSGGQLIWEGTVTVDSEDQDLKVYTHILNNGSDSQFSIHRDGRFNTKALEITLSGDATGNLIEYNASGTIQTGGESIYVTATQAQ